MATDHAEYAEWIAEAGNAEPLLTALDWESPMTHERPVTKFEGKAHQVGQRDHRIDLGEDQSMSVSEQLSDDRDVAGIDRSTSVGDSRHPKRVLLVWDAPNLDMGLGAILGGRPTAAYRPRFDALGRWLLGRTAELSARTSGTLEPEATVFTNIAPGSADVVRPWVEALRNVGFAVFAKPKVDEDSDVDSDMLEHIDSPVPAAASPASWSRPPTVRRSANRLEDIAATGYPGPGSRVP